MISLLPFKTLEDVEAGLRMVEADLQARRNLHGVFTTTYRLSTRAIIKLMDGGGFEDANWVARFLIAFANLYRQALADYAGGRRERVPVCWQQALNASNLPGVRLAQHLLLGINAHVNHDLAMALKEAGVDGDLEMRHRDFLRVNLAMRMAAEEAKDVLAEKYAYSLGLTDYLLGELSGQFIARNFELLHLIRENGWAAGVALVHAASPGEQQRVGAMIEESSSLFGCLILLANSSLPAIISRLPAEIVAMSHRFNPAADLARIVRRLGELVSLCEYRTRLSIGQAIRLCLARSVLQPLLSRFGAIAGAGRMAFSG